MGKPGRLYTQIDVNWYDEWGHAVSNDSALLWVLAVGQAKRVKSSTLTLGQLRRVAPSTMTTTEFSNAVSGLIGCDIAPISGDDRAIVLHGWESWNDMKDSSDAGEYGNHIRWHVNGSSPSPTCGYCVDRPDSPPIVAPDRYREEKRREEKSIGETVQKDRKTGPPRTFPVTASLRDWATKNSHTSIDLEVETKNFLDYHSAKGSKFVDWDRAWQTWIRKGDGWAKERDASKPKLSIVARGADPLPPEDDFGERVYLPGEQ